MLSVTLAGRLEDMAAGNDELMHELSEGRALVMMHVRQMLHAADRLQRLAGSTPDAPACPQ